MIVEGEADVGIRRILQTEEDDGKVNSLGEPRMAKNRFGQRPVTGLDKQSALVTTWRAANSLSTVQEL